jgi:hypothetical protein
MARAANETVETPFVRERLQAIGVTIPGPERRTLAYLAKFIPSEIDRWVAPIKAAGVTAD